MKALFFSLLFVIPSFAFTQQAPDTLIATIKIYRTPDGYVEWSYSKDITYPDSLIISYIFDMFARPGEVPPRKQPKGKNYKL